MHQRPPSGEKLGPPAGEAGAECVREPWHGGCRGREGPPVAGPQVREDWFYLGSLRRATVELKQRRDQIYVFNLPLLVAVENGLEGVQVAMEGVGAQLKSSMLTIMAP